MHGAWFSWRIVLVGSGEAFEQAPSEEFPMRDLELDLLLAAETSELEAIEPGEEQKPGSGETAAKATPLDTRVQLDDVTVRADEPEESVGAEDEAERVASDHTDAGLTASPLTSSGAIDPDLRLAHFAPRRARLENRHLGPLLALARTIVGSQGGRRPVERVRVTGVPGAAGPHSRALAESRARAVALALREAVERMWLGCGSRAEFTTSVRTPAGSRSGQRVSAPAAVEIFTESGQASEPVAYPEIVLADDGGLVWQFEPVLRTANGSAEPSNLPPLSSAGYFFVLSSEAPPLRWICSLEVTMESADRHLPHAEYTGKLAATGLLVSPRHILTAAHCVFSRLSERSVRELEAGDARPEDPLLRATSIAVFPGRNGGALPFGSYMIRDPKCMRSSARWRVSRAVNIESDFALLTLDRPLAIGSWGQPPYHVVSL